MPNSRSFRRVALQWLLRAGAFLLCLRAIFSAARSYSGWEARPSSHHDLTTAAAARWTWQSVSSGFFPPMSLVDSRQQQVAHRRDRQVPLQPQPAAALVVPQADFPFLVLETPCPSPATAPRAGHATPDDGGASLPGVAASGCRRASGAPSSPDRVGRVGKAAWWIGEGRSSPNSAYAPRPRTSAHAPPEPAKTPLSRRTTRQR
jgi:hypothetical protein